MVLIGSLLPVLVLFFGCLMVRQDVILPFVLFGFVFVCFGGIWLVVLGRFLVFIVCWSVLLGTAVIGFRPEELAWDRPGLPLLSNLSGPIQHFRGCYP